MLTRTPQLCQVYLAGLFQGMGLATFDDVELQAELQESRARRANLREVVQAAGGNDSEDKEGHHVDHEGKQINSGDSNRGNDGKQPQQQDGIKFQHNENYDHETSPPGGGSNNSKNSSKDALNSQANKETSSSAAAVASASGDQTGNKNVTGSGVDHQPNVDTSVDPAIARTAGLPVIDRCGGLVTEFFSWSQTQTDVTISWDQTQMRRCLQRNQQQFQFASGGALGGSDDSSGALDGSDEVSRVFNQPRVVSGDAAAAAAEVKGKQVKIDFSHDQIRVEVAGVVLMQGSVSLSLMF